MTVSTSSGNPPPNTHTPASMASWTTAWAASPTAGNSSAGMWSIAPLGNEIRYRVISQLLSRRPAPAASQPRPYAVETDKPPKTHCCSGRSGFTSSGVIPHTLAQADATAEHRGSDADVQSVHQATHVDGNARFSAPPYGTE